MSSVERWTSTTRSRRKKPDFEVVEESLSYYFSSDEILKFILETLVQVQED